MANSHVTARLIGYVALFRLAVIRLGRLNEQLIRHQFQCHIHFMGISALPVALGVAALCGVLVVNFVVALLGANGELVQKWIFWGLFFELSPLVAAVLVIARSSAATASDLAIMRLNDEFLALQRMNVSVIDYQMLPRIWALFLGLPVITIFSQIVAVLCGWLWIAYVQQFSLLQLVGSFLIQVHPGLVVASLGKASLMGGVIGIVGCYHGYVAEKSESAISGAGIAAVGNAMIGILMIDMITASIVYFLN